MGILEFLKTRKYSFFLGLIIFLGIFLRFNQNIFEIGYHFDEIAMAAVAKQDFPFGILKAAAKYDYHAPLYYFILHFLEYLKQEWVYMRLMNFVFSVLNIYVFYKIGSILKNKSTGLILALILSFNHFFIGVSYFIKFYCLDFLIFSIAIYYFIKILKYKKGYLKFAISNSFFILSSTLGFVFVFFEYLALFLAKKIDKKTIKTALLPICAFGLYFPILLSQTILSSENILSPHIHHLKITPIVFFVMLNDYFCPLVHNFALIPSASAIDVFLEGIKGNIFQIIIFIVFSLIPVCFGIYFIINSLKKEKFLRLLSLPSALFMLFFMILTFFEITGYMPFYIFPFGIMLLILIGAGISLLKSKKLKIAIIIYLFLINTLVSNYYPKEKREWTYSKQYICAIEYIQKMKKNTPFIATYAGRFLKLYFKDRNIINFDEEASGGFFGKEMLEKYYGEDFVLGLNKKNFFPRLKKYILENKKNPKFEEYVKKEYLDKIPKKGTIVFSFLSEVEPFIPNKKDISKVLQNENIYYNLYPFYLSLRDDDIFDADNLADLSSGLINSSLIEIIEKNNFKRIKIERCVLKPSGDFERAEFKDKELPNTIWLMENLLYGWTFVTYQKE